MKDYGENEQPWHSIIGKITTVKFDEKVTTIGGRSFEERINLKDVTISTSMKTINSYAFSGCSLLTSIEL